MAGKLRRMAVVTAVVAVLLALGGSAGTASAWPGPQPFASWGEL